MFDNPTVATEAVRVNFSTITRQDSLAENAFGFSLSSASSLAQFMASTVTYATVPLDSYSATFYYLDTTASEVYANPASTKPLIGVYTPEHFSWEDSEQAVYVNPSYTKRVNVRDGAGQTLTAGVTSQAFVLAIEDNFGNPTPVVADMEDSTGTGVAFDLLSYSGGQVMIGYPDPQNMTGNPGIAKLMLGESATSFYLIDTLASPSHRLDVDSDLEKGWEAAVSSYVVVASSPSRIEFITPSRRLVAGTTVQYAPEYEASNYVTALTTPTMLTVALKDKYVNTASSTSRVDLVFSAVRTTTFGGLTPSAEVGANENWRQLNASPQPISIMPGFTQASIYVWDEKTDENPADPVKVLIGTATVTVSATIPADSITLPSIWQDQYITPAPATYFTLHHVYTLANPLGVQNSGDITLRARDRFGNIAGGDPTNGQYYTGKINMATSSKGTAKLRDYINTSATDYTFVRVDRGERTLMVEDTMVETLKLNVTDFFQPTIYGHTSDSTRGLPVASAGDVVFSGLLITPTDMSPEDPLIGDKISMGMTKLALYQGDGLLNDVPAPVAMMRLNMKTAPTGAPTTYLKSIQVKSSGTLVYSDIAEVALYVDNLTSGRLGMFDGEDVLGGNAVDTFISSGIYTSGSWYFNDLNVKLATGTLVTNTPRNYFLAVRVSTTAETPRSFALAMDNQSFVTLTSTQVGVAYNNFPVVTATSPVRNQPAVIFVQGTDIAAWWQPVVGGTPLALDQYNYADQGETRVGMLKLEVWTDGFIGTLKSFKIIKQGSGPGTDIASMRLFLDAVEGDYTQGNGVFEATIDKEVTNTATPPVGDPEDTESFVLPLADTNAYGRVDGSTRTYFVVFEIGPDALTGLTHGARLEPSGVGLIDGWVAAFSPIVSGVVPVRVTPDIVYLSDVNKSLPNDFSRPTFLTQNDSEKAVARLTMQIDGLKGSGIWKGLKLDRWINHFENSGSTCTNKASDVTKINVWYDSTGDGLLQTEGALRDTEVLRDNGRNRVFPVSTLAQALDASTDVIHVADIQQFFPADSPFPQAPGRLVLNDGQSDTTLKEIVYYTAVNINNNTFEGVSRGVERSTATVYSTGTVVSGQAILPLIGTGSILDGQVLYTTPKDYFVTFNIAPLATVGNSANLGLAIRGTDYFLLESSKTMSTVNLGVMPPGKSISLIGKTREYPDRIIIKATNTITGDTLQQKKTDQACWSTPRARSWLTGRRSTTWTRSSSGTTRTATAT